MAEANIALYTAAIQALSQSQRFGCRSKNARRTSMNLCGCGSILKSRGIRRFSKGPKSGYQFFGPQPFECPHLLMFFFFLGGGLLRETIQKAPTLIALRP